MTVEPQRRIGLRLRLDSGPCTIALQRLHRIVGYASLTGEPEGSFMGWLTFHGEQVPVFDLNRVVCDQPTAECFGSRIILIATLDASVPLIGLLAAGLTDTISATGETAQEFLEIDELHIDSYLTLLYPLIPATPGAPA